IATGHHARIERDDNDSRYLLKRGMDHHKDQTYMLYRLTQEQMRHTLLPIGHLEKKQVRQIARELDLPVAAKAESQDICFIPNNHYSGFLSQRISGMIKPGPILDVRGRTIGEHKGSQFYTIGQRRKLGVTAKNPLFVIAILPEKNAVVVGEECNLYRSELTASHINWISGRAPAQRSRLTAKIRYAHPGAEAEISLLGDDTLKIVFQEPQKAIAPGQSVVFYDGDITLGGGIIE
ncbi:MAG TPA: tRNA 2-thiouridine(34) synthase MnmA, partial [Dehalococcoidia bacterium]|nr:tRNA 2-thiouridine(34) synthase MnmA [Dehalococcoidia bacterium]